MYYSTSIYGTTPPSDQNLIDHSQNHGSIQFSSPQSHIECDFQYNKRELNKQFFYTLQLIKIRL